MARGKAAEAEAEAPAEEKVEVRSEFLRSEVASGSQEVAKLVFQSLLANGSATMVEDPVDEPEAEAPAEEPVEEE